MKIIIEVKEILELDEITKDEIKEELEEALAVIDVEVIEIEFKN